ncbi:MAG: ATP-binding protein [Prochlorothrix sp.]|nr:ATP-binding protein [Prochlorothrix sp.]
MGTSRFPRSRLSRRLLSGFSLSWLTAGIMTLAVNYVLIERDLQGQIQRRAQSITQGLQIATAGLIEVSYNSLLSQVVTQYANLPDVQEVAIVDAQSTIIAHSRVTAIYRPYPEVQPQISSLVQSALAQNTEYSATLALEGIPVIVQVLPFQWASLSNAQNSTIGAAIVVLDLRPLQYEARRTLIASSATLGGGMLLILIVMALLLQRQVLAPLEALDWAVRRSQETGDFHLDAQLPTNEIRFLAQTFESVFNQLALYDRLETEVKQRIEVEAELRQSETRERAKSEALSQALQDLHQTQVQLIQTEKMSSLGRMVAGIAHEINNPVNFIHGNLKHLEDYGQDLLDLLALYQTTYPHPPADIQQRETVLDLPFLRQDLKAILTSLRRGTERIQSIVLSLRQFSHLDESDLKPVDLHQNLEATLLIIANRLHTAHPTITLHQLYGELPLVECYPSELNQVFLQILTNAIDALQEVQSWSDRSPLAPLPPSHPLAKPLAQAPLRPTIWIHTCFNPAPAPDSPATVTLRIRDNGPGIAPETLAHLFDPFFTTKPVGQGTGMGLSISYQIVVGRHRGKLWVESTPQQGAEFILELPLSQTPSPPPQQPLRTTQPSALQPSALQRSNQGSPAT